MIQGWGCVCRNILHHCPPSPHFFFQIFRSHPPLHTFCLNCVLLFYLIIEGERGGFIIFGQKNCLWHAEAVGGQKRLVLMVGVIGIIKNNEVFSPFLTSSLLCFCPSSLDVVQWPRRCWVKGLLESPWPSMWASLWESWWLCTLQEEFQV